MLVHFLKRSRATMPRAFSTIRARRTALARFLAAMLVALAISPFTAPFSAVDVAELDGGTPLHLAQASALKALKDVATLDPFIVAFVPSSFWAAAFRDLLNGHLSIRPILVLVLRI